LVYKGFFIRSSEDEGRSMHCFTDSDEVAWSQEAETPVPATFNGLRFEAEEFCPTFEVEEVGNSLTEN